MSGSPATSKISSSGDRGSKGSEEPGPIAAKTPSPGSATSASPERIRVIPEIYQDYNDLGYKHALKELDTALDDACQLIIIEPMRLGDETARWIAVGNFLHKYTVLAGTAATIGLATLPRHWLIITPLVVSSLVTYSVYTLSWAPDPAVKYQVERDPNVLTGLEVCGSASSVVVLKRRDDGPRKVLHTAVTTLLVAALAYRTADYYLRS